MITIAISAFHPLQRYYNKLEQIRDMRIQYYLIIEMLGTERVESDLLLQKAQYCLTNTLCHR